MNHDKIVKKISLITFILINKILNSYFWLFTKNTNINKNDSPGWKITGLPIQKQNINLNDLE